MHDADMSTYEIHLLNYMKGDIFEALILSDVGQGAIVRFRKSTIKDDVQFNAYISFCKLLKPLAERVLQIWKMYSKEAWDDLSKKSHDHKELSAAKRALRALWNKREEYTW